MQKNMENVDCCMAEDISNNGSGDREILAPNLYGFGLRQGPRVISGHYEFETVSS